MHHTGVGFRVPNKFLNPKPKNIPKLDFETRSRVWPPGFGIGASGISLRRLFQHARETYCAPKLRPLTRPARIPAFAVAKHRRRTRHAHACMTKCLNFGLGWLEVPSEHLSDVL